MIADRLVRKATAKAPTINGKSEALKRALVKVIRQQLTGCNSKECREDYREKFADVARKNLTEAEFKALMETTKLGYRAVGAEQ